MVEHIPQQHHELETIACGLPLYDTSVAYPFTGFVFNVQSRADGHVDANDRGIYLVIPIGEFEHGELVLEELGVVLGLQSGEAIAFLSP